MADKRNNALAFRSECAVRRPILLDDIEGTVHRAFGLLPNMTWILGPGGIVLYKAAWTVVPDVEEALSDAVNQLARRRPEGLVPVYSERVAWRKRDMTAFREGLQRAGPQAVRDFFKDEP